MTVYAVIESFNTSWLYPDIGQSVPVVDRMFQPMKTHASIDELSGSCRFRRTKLHEMALYIFTVNASDMQTSEFVAILRTTVVDTWHCVRDTVTDPIKPIFGNAGGMP